MAILSPRLADLLYARGGVCFSRHRACLPRRHPGRACTAASSRARAAGVVAEACTSGSTSVHIRQSSGLARNNLTSVAYCIRINSSSKIRTVQHTQWYTSAKHSSNNTNTARYEISYKNTIHIKIRFFYRWEKTHVEIKYLVHV